jgi:4-amino-4-deoxychorismate lyase
MESTLRNLSEQELSRLELIETFRFAPAEGFIRLDLHLRRMARSAAALGLPFRRDLALRTVDPISAEVPLRLRLSLDHTGQFALASAPLAPNPRQWRFAIGQARLDPADPWLRHKTNRRALYDQTRAHLPESVDEVLFCNTAGRLCEGTISNVFLERGGRLLTPKLGAGLLPGVLRQHLLATGQAEEADLTPDDLGCAEAVFFGNSLRGLIPARPA